MFAVKANAVTEFVDAALAHKEPEILLCLKKIEATEEQLARALAISGRSTAQITQQIYAHWKAACPKCGKALQPETLAYLAKFHNLRGAATFQCPECSEPLTDLKVTWVDHPVN